MCLHYFYPITLKCITAKFMPIIRKLFEPIKAGLKLSEALVLKAPVLLFRFFKKTSYLKGALIFSSKSSWRVPGV